MKKQYFNLRTLAMVLSLSGLMAVAATPVFATDKNFEIVSADSLQPSVKHIASDETGSTFLVKFEAASPVKFEVKIVNRNGAVLFSQVYEEAYFSKTYKILYNDNGNIQSSIVIRQLPEGNPIAFNISSSDKLVTEIAIKKLRTNK